MPLFRAVIIQVCVRLHFGASADLPKVVYGDLFKRLIPKFQFLHYRSEREQILIPRAPYVGNAVKLEQNLCIRFRSPVGIVNSQAFIFAVFYIA
jgi:hypothetical protein